MKAQKRPLTNAPAKTPLQTQKLVSVRWSFAALLLLAACAPSVSEVRSETLTYAAPAADVFSRVLSFTTADAGIPPYNPGGVNGYPRGPSTPWLVTLGDRGAGLIVAEARSRAAGFIGSDAPPDVHQVNIVICESGAEPPSTQVSVRGTPQTRVFLNRLKLYLERLFPR